MFYTCTTLISIQQLQGLQLIVSVDVHDAILDSNQDVGVTVTFADQGTLAFPEDSGQRALINHNTQLSLRKVFGKQFLLLS